MTNKTTSAIDPTQWGDEVAEEMRAYYEANRRQKWVEGTADNLMLGLLNIALRAKAERTTSAIDLVTFLRGFSPNATREGERERIVEAADTITRLKAALDECAGALSEARERIAARTCGMTPTLERIDRALSSVGGEQTKGGKNEDQA